MRIGIHTGPALEKGGDLFGRNVALAARVADKARGGEILSPPKRGEAAAEADELAFADAAGGRAQGAARAVDGDRGRLAGDLSRAQEISAAPSHPGGGKSVWVTRRMRRSRNSITCASCGISSGMRVSRAVPSDPGPDQRSPVVAQPQLLDHRVPVGEDLVDVAHQGLHPDVAVVGGLAESAALAAPTSHSHSGS